MDTGRRAAPQDRWNLEAGAGKQQTDDSGYIIVGQYAMWGATGANIYIVKTNANGDTLWTKIYDTGTWEGAGDVIETPDGGYLIVGYTQIQGVGNADLWLLKTDNNGDTLWTKLYGGP